MLRSCRNVSLFCGAILFSAFACTNDATAQTTPGVGWTASLSNDFHNVSGNVSVVDADTLLVDNFTFDGGGITVLFYLGAADTQAAFSAGLPIGSDLLGTVYDGSQAAFTVDLPTGTTIDGYNAISVWCTAADVSFGSGTFQPVPEPALGGFLSVAALGCLALRRRNSCREIKRCHAQTGATRS